MGASITSTHFHFTNTSSISSDWQKFGKDLGINLKNQQIVLNSKTV
jgi:hypothetical protein